MPTVLLNWFISRILGRINCRYTKKNLKINPNSHLKQILLSNLLFYQNFWLYCASNLIFWSIYGGPFHYIIPLCSCLHIFVCLFIFCCGAQTCYPVARVRRSSSGNCCADKRSGLSLNWNLFCCDFHSCCFYISFCHLQIYQLPIWIAKI